MKYRLVLISIISLILSGCVGEEIPEKVTQKFNQMAPKADSVHWMIDYNMYKVYYRVDGVKTTSYYDFNGKWMETEIEVKELPKEISDVIEAGFSEFKMVDIEIVYTFDNKVYYEVDLESESKTYDILFDSTGRILRKKI